MKRTLFVLAALLILTAPVVAQTPPPVPPTDKKADPKKPEKAEQEPRPVAQELQKQESQQKDAPPPPAPAPAPVPGAVAPATEPEKTDKKDEKKWDVNNPPGPSHDVTIDVTKGTWLSLDVSPDGKEIAFDLLGDIYVIPFGGGEAKAIASGVAWEMQPRFSPNGKWIAFTSDRSGGDNVWTMNRDGSDAKQVSKESCGLV
jgi:hypothetical protein